MHRHTPGPWAIEKDGNPIVTNGATMICMVPEKHPQAEANLALICAAPDLLESLETTLAYIYTLEAMPCIAKAMQVVGKARKAIAKATSHVAGDSKPPTTRDCYSDEATRQQFLATLATPQQSPFYVNYYKCICGEQWTDVHDCTCNDRCPACNKEIEPYSSQKAVRQICSTPRK